MLTFSFLTKEFYKDYAHCPEIAAKSDRPYIQIRIEVDGVLFGVPLRSHINHPHVFWTNKPERCGADFSKAVVISDPQRYLDPVTKPYIRREEFAALRGKEYILKEKLRSYIAAYQKAKRAPTVPRNQRLLSYSSLQYFEEYLP